MIQLVCCPVAAWDPAKTRDPMDQESLEPERAKIRLDSIKHLSTLNTASIIIIGALIDKFGKPLELIYVSNCQMLWIGRP
jgi:hypothetical protein